MRICRLLTRLDNIRDSMEEALDDIKGIEDDYRRGLLEAHVRGAIREINAQITELVSSHEEMVGDWGEPQRHQGRWMLGGLTTWNTGNTVTGRHWSGCGST